MAITILSLTIIAMVSNRFVVRGFIAAGVGILLSTIGLDPMLGTERFTFGRTDLSAGIAFMPLLIGMLAFVEVFNQFSKRSRGAPEINVNVQQEKGLTVQDVKDTMPAIMRGTFIGTAIGTVPGLGATIAAFLAYSEAKRNSKTPEKFGKGSLEGVAAPEAANNAVNGANMIPLLTLGIPGDVGAAILIGALLLQGLSPGPMLFQEHLHIVYAIFAGLMVSHVFTVALAIPFIRVATLITRIPSRILFPIVGLFCVIGTYVVNHSLFDVSAMIVFGIIGVIMTRFHFSTVTLLIGFILGPLLEQAVRQTMVMSGGDITVIFRRPISLALLIVTGLLIFLIIRAAKRVPVRKA
jgi:putative tricarboxylic transport membrane protein